MSSAVSIAAASVTANQAQLQSAIATKITKANAEREQSVVQLIEAASANLQEVVNSATESGVGANLDISA